MSSGDETSFRNVYESADYAEDYAALEWTGTYHLVRRELPEILRAHVTGRRAVDFGCGTGRTARLLRSLGFEVTGVDISPSMIARARQLDPEGDYRLLGGGGLGELGLGPVDLVASLLFCGFLTLETVADQQQWMFHLEKKVRLLRGEVPAEPFCRRGLWAWSRHPNFFAEQAQWWVFTLFPLAVGVGWLNYGVVGAVLLTLLFDGSTRFTEAISLSKYPSYADYQRTVSRWIPLPPRG